MKTFLQLIQQAADEVGIPQPTQIIGAVDDQARQLLALANREGKDFSVMANTYGGWQNLHKDYVFFTEVLSPTTGDIVDGSRIISNIPTTSGITAGAFFVDGEDLPIKARVLSVDSATQVTIDRPVTATTTGVTLTFARGGYPLPDDFDYFAQQTYWDGAFRWQLLGPISAQEKQVLKYGISPVGPRARFWIQSNLLYLDPVPATNNQTIAFDYYSNAWCQSAGGVDQSSWTADTDTYKLDEDTFVEGIKWRFLRAKGLDYAEEKNNWDASCMRVLSRDGGNRDLPLNSNSPRDVQLLSTNQIPDTGYGA